MRSDHRWFTKKAELAWRARPGRSFVGLIPFGCGDQEFARYLYQWLSGAFVPPEQDERVAVARVVPDKNTSSVGFLQQIAKAFEASAETRFDIDFTGEPSQAFEVMIYRLHERRVHPLIIIERFHSFASVPDSSLLSLLSSMRSLEHNYLLTTIALSPVVYEVLRRSVAQTLPFVNSAYGDNHDRAIMPPLSLAEFTEHAAKYRIEAPRAAALYCMGGGPDVVYQALLDEALIDSGDIAARCALKIDDLIGRFMHYAIGDAEDHIFLLERLIMGSSTASDIAFLNALPVHEFIAIDTEQGYICRGEVLRNYIFNRLEKSSRISKKRIPDSLTLKVLVVSANSLKSPLDLEGEIRNMSNELERTEYRSRITIQHCLGARPDDIILALRRFNPHVVHFSGHGNQLGIELRSDDGASGVVLGTAIASALSGRSVKLVVLNVCQSSAYAKDVARSVNVVVSTMDEVDDEAAKRFTLTFYRTVAEGFTVGDAFKDAIDSIALHNLESVFRITGDAQLTLIERTRQP